MSMPFASLVRPSLGLGLLQAILVDHGFSAVTIYANLLWGEKTGLRLYQLGQRGSNLVGDWVFSPAAFFDDPSLRDRFESTVAQWIESWTNRDRIPVLRRTFGVPGGRIVQDTRSCSVEEFYVLEDPELALLDYCKLPRRLSDLPVEAGSALETLMERLFIINHEDVLLIVITDNHEGRRFSRV